MYYFHPLQAGPRESWPHHFGRCQQMGFDSVLAAPIFAPGASGEIFLAGDHERVHPLLGQPAEVDALVVQLARACRQHGLALLLDIVIGRIAPDADLVRSNPNWFDVVDPDAGRLDPRTLLAEPKAAYVRFNDPLVAKHAADWWIDRLSRLARAGAKGFRCLEPHLVPASIWRRIIDSVRQADADCRFLAWTPGLDWRAIADFENAGFAAAFSSLPWWDGRGAWFVEEHALLRRLGSVISAPEAPFGPRLARRLEDTGNPLARYRHVLRRAAATGNGMLVPMGFESACGEDMQSRPLPNDGFPALQESRFCVAMLKIPDRPRRLRSS